jgi:hypothetical protein
VGTVSTGTPGSSVIVTNSGTTSAAVLDFTIPKGDAGENGTGSGTVTTVFVGAGLAGADITSAGTISHADTSAQTNITATADTFVDGLTFDDYGHVTGVTTSVVQGFDGDYNSLTNKPTLFDGTYASLTGSPTLGTAAATASTDYATAAQGALADTALQPNASADFGANQITYSNIYANLVDLPNASSYHGMFAHVHATGKGYFAHNGSWVELANASELFDGDYNSLTNKPTIPANAGDLGDVTITAAATGEVLKYNGTAWVDANVDYSELTGTPTLFDGAYGSLTGTPTIPSNVEDLANVTVTAATTGEVLRYDGAAWVDAVLNYSDLAGTPTLFDGAYGSLTGVPSTFTPSAHTHAIVDVTGLQTALDAKQDAVSAFDGAYGSLTGVPSTFTPSAHTHAIVDVTGLQTALDAKQDAVSAFDGTISGSPPELVFNNTAASANEKGWNVVTTATGDFRIYGADDAGDFVNTAQAYTIARTGANIDSHTWKTSNVDRLQVDDTAVHFLDYGSGAITGTATYSLAVDANGTIIEEPLGGGVSENTDVTFSELTVDDTLPAVILSESDEASAQQQTRLLQSSGDFSVHAYDGQNLSKGVGYTISKNNTTGQFEQHKWHSNGTAVGSLDDTGLQLNDYGSGTVSGTATYSLAVDQYGNVIEEGLKADATHTHAISDVTNLQTELNAKVNSTSIGIANGVAGLDADGKVPSTQLPSYVDDIIEGADLTALQALTVGEKVSGKIYVALDTNKTYRWSGSAFVEVSAALATADNLTTARTISLSGDATGSVSFDGSADADIAVTIADDSHNHTIANVDGLQTQLDAKATTGKAIAMAIVFG